MVGVAAEPSMERSVQKKELKQLLKVKRGK
jgi:hypothetical protein